MTTICLLGDRDLRLPTHRELDVAVRMLADDVEVRWVDSDDDAARARAGWHGLWVIPGSPYRDDDAVDAAIAWALDTGTPFLGTCGGFQYAALTLARLRASVREPQHAEVRPDAPDPVIAPLACSLIGERREVRCVPGTRLAAMLGEEPFDGFHWCGYGLTDRHAKRLEAGGVVVSARAPDAGVEAIEVPDHPFFVATLFQPQVGASSGRPLSPLITGFATAASATA